jgi:DNA-binding IclR family transcriptional regulator
VIGVLSVGVALTNREGRANESMALNCPAEATTEEKIKANVPELRRAASRLSELLEGSVY